MESYRILCLIFFLSLGVMIWRLNYVVYISILCLFIAELYSTLWMVHNLFIHSPFTSWWILELFLVWCYYKQIFYKHSFTEICVYICFYFSQISIQESDRGVIWEATIFSKWLSNFTLLPIMLESFSCSLYFSHFSSMWL